MVRRFLGLVVVIVAFAACSPEFEDNPESYNVWAHQTWPDKCLNRKIDRLASIDHETPNGEALAVLVEFCKSEYGNREAINAND